MVLVTSYLCGSDKFRSILLNISVIACKSKRRLAAPILHTTVRVPRTDRYIWGPTDAEADVFGKLSMKRSDRGQIIAHIRKKDVTTYKHNTQHIHHTSSNMHTFQTLHCTQIRIRTYHAHPQNIYSAPQTKHYSTQHVATLLYSIHTANYKAHTIHFRNKMCTVRYKQYNVSARQLQYMVT